MIGSSKRRLQISFFHGERRIEMTRLNVCAPLDRSFSLYMEGGVKSATWVKKILLQQRGTNETVPQLLIVVHWVVQCSVAKMLESLYFFKYESHTEHLVIQSHFLPSMLFLAKGDNKSIF